MASKPTAGDKDVIPAIPLPPRLPPRRLIHKQQRVKSLDIDLLDHVPPAPSADLLNGTLPIVPVVHNNNNNCNNSATSLLVNSGSDIVATSANGSPPCTSFTGTGKEPIQLNKGNHIVGTDGSSVNFHLTTINDTLSNSNQQLTTSSTSPANASVTNSESTSSTSGPWLPTPIYSIGSTGSSNGSLIQPLLPSKATGNNFNSLGNNNHKQNNNNISNSSKTSEPFGSSFASNTSYFTSFLPCQPVGGVNNVNNSSNFTNQLLKSSVAPALVKSFDDDVSSLFKNFNTGTNTCSLPSTPISSENLLTNLPVYSLLTRASSNDQAFHASKVTTLQPPSSTLTSSYFLPSTSITSGYKSIQQSNNTISNFTNPVFLSTSVKDTLNAASTATNCSSALTSTSTAAAATITKLSPFTSSMSHEPLSHTVSAPSGFTNTKNNKNTNCELACDEVSTSTTSKANTLTSLKDKLETSNNSTELYSNSTYFMLNKLTKSPNHQKSIMSSCIDKDNLIDFATVSDLIETHDVLSLFDPLSQQQQVNPPSTTSNCVTDANVDSFEHRSTSSTSSTSSYHSVYSNVYNESTSNNSSNNKNNINNKNSSQFEPGEASSSLNTQQAGCSTDVNSIEANSCLSSSTSSPKACSSSSVQSSGGTIHGDKRIVIVHKPSRQCDSLPLFESKLRSLKSKYKFDDSKTNTGLVISPIIETQANDHLSVKLTITTPYGPSNFTCNVNTSIELVIQQALCSKLDDTSTINFDSFILKVYNRSEYFGSNSTLNDYAYVLECHKYARDVKLTLVKANECHRLFARTAADDDYFQTKMSTEVLLPEKFKTLDDATYSYVSYEALNVLIDTLDHEISLCLNTFKYASDDDYASQKPFHHGVRQAIQAICISLGSQCTASLRESIEDFTSRIGLFKELKENLKQSDVLDSKNYELIDGTLEKLYKSVTEIIHLYSKAFPVDFEVVLSSEEIKRQNDRDNAPIRYSIDCHESFICLVGQLSQPAIDWSTSYRKFLLQVELWHGQCKLASATSEKQYLQPGVFKFSRILFDEWISIEKVSISALPRETTIYFSIIGIEYCDQEISSNSGGLVTSSATNTCTNQESMCTLAMSMLKLFDAEGKLVQGSQLLTMWNASYIKDENRYSINTNCLEKEAPILSISLPEFDYNIKFPQVNLDNVTVAATDALSEKSQLHHLNDTQVKKSPLASSMQANIYKVLNRDPLEEMLNNEKRLLWENRDSLRDVPSALPKVLISNNVLWNYDSLPMLYHMINTWSPLTPIDAMNLLLPKYPDLHVRKMAVEWLKGLGADGLIDYLPQLIQAIRFEPYLDSPLVWWLLESSLTNVRVAHSLYWLLKETFDDPLLGFRSGVISNALLAICGDALKKMILQEEKLQVHLTNVSEAVKREKENSRLTRLQSLLEEKVVDYFKSLNSGVCLPLSPSAIVVDLNIATCSYFTSNTIPLKLSFKPINDSKPGDLYSDFRNPDPHSSNANSMMPSSSFVPYVSPSSIDTIFKIGDDLRQDTLTMQIIRIMDKLWLKEGLDLRIVTFNCVSTGDRKGFVEMVPNAETLRKIQQELGIGGAFNERAISLWLRKHNTLELNYVAAVENFILSTAGYIVATYILGVCDRHNDNIMITTAGHLFHIDFGKFLGDAQMVGTIKRDRVPFVLTSDMAYVINGGSEQTKNFQDFVELCCQALNIIRRNSNLFLSLFSLMTCSSIPGVTSESVKFVHRALLPHLSEEQAMAQFNKKIIESLKAKSVQINFFVHALGQMRFTGDHNDQKLLSFAPNTVTLESTRGSKILNLSIVSYFKNYEPEKCYFYIVKMKRSFQPDASFVIRSFNEFYEFYSKLTAKFPLVSFGSLSTGTSIVGRSNTQDVAEKRKKALNKFLHILMSHSDEISHCDLVYTFFQPLLRDQELQADPATIFNRPKIKAKTDRNIINNNNSGLNNASGSIASSSDVKIPPPDAQIKLCIHYKNGSLNIMVKHVKNAVSRISDSKPPDTYVKTKLTPDPRNETKKKTKIVTKNSNPTFMEMISYHIPESVVKEKVLNVSVWETDLVHGSCYLGAALIPLGEMNLKESTESWYPFTG